MLHCGWVECQGQLGALCLGVGVVVLGGFASQWVGLRGLTSHGVCSGVSGVVLCIQSPPFYAFALHMHVRWSPL